jgi:ComF family protein
LCRHCLTRPLNLTALRSWAQYEGCVQHAIQRLKYGRSISLGLILAESLTAIFTTLDWQVDLVIPVPLGVARLRERGYNQAVLIARPFALETGLPYSAKGLARVRETRSQVGLSLAQRQYNVKQAFAADKEIIFQQSILLIDDVTTSGATLSSCGDALFTAGAKNVYAMTLARA